jgi:hypothetical protein
MFMMGDCSITEKVSRIQSVGFAYSFNSQSSSFQSIAEGII